MDESVVRPVCGSVDVATVVEVAADGVEVELDDVAEVREVVGVADGVVVRVVLVEDVVDEVFELEEDDPPVLRSAAAAANSFAT